jgi:uncharacterized Zn finger protein (UPF0148 family)
MISKWDIRQYHKLHTDEIGYHVDENDMIVNNETGKILCSLDDFTDSMRKKLHCDFESIYYCHGMLQNVLRCRECGAVIFTYEDEYEDLNLCCPVCANYETYYKYYTAEDIEQDEEKRKEIELLEEMKREMIEEDKRWKKRKGKYDYQICKGRIPIGYKYAIYYDLECNNLFKSGLKGLKLILNWAVKDGMCYTYQKRIIIPLSLYAIKIMILSRRMRRNEALGR